MYIEASEVIGDKRATCWNNSDVRNGGQLTVQMNIDYSGKKKNIKK